MEKCLVSVKDPDGISVDFRQEDFEAIEETVSKAVVLASDNYGRVDLQRPNTGQKKITLGFEVVYPRGQEEAQLRVILKETGQIIRCDIKKAAEAIVSNMNRDGLYSYLFDEDYLWPFKEKLQESYEQLTSFSVPIENGRGEIFGRGRIETGIGRYCVAAFDRIRIELKGGGPAEITLRNCVGTGAELGNLENPVCRFITEYGNILEFALKESFRENNPHGKLFSYRGTAECFNTTSGRIPEWEDKTIYYDILADNEEEYFRVKGKLITRGENREERLARDILSGLVSFRNPGKEKKTA